MSRSPAPASFQALPVTSSSPVGYDAWFAKVDAIIVSRAGVNAADLPDFCYLDAFEDGASPAATAGRVIRAARDY